MSITYYQEPIKTSSLDITLLYVFVCYNNVAASQAALRPHGVLCPDHTNEECAASPKELTESVLNQEAKVRRYMQRWSAQNLTDQEVEKLWNEAKIPLLVLRCAMNSALFPNPFRGKDVVVLSTKTRRDATVLYACPNCSIGRLVTAIRARVVEPLKKLQLDLEEVTKLEEYIFLTPRKQTESKTAYQDLKRNNY